MLQSRGDNTDGKQAGTTGETFIESFQREQGMSSEERAAEKAKVEAARLERIAAILEEALVRRRFRSSLPQAGTCHIYLLISCPLSLCSRARRRACGAVVNGRSALTLFRRLVAIAVPLWIATIPTR